MSEVVTETLRLSKLQLKQLLEGREIVIPTGKNFMNEVLVTKIVMGRRERASWI